MHVTIVLNERERELVIRRLRADAGPATEQHFSWVQFRAAFTDYKVYLHSLVYICGSIPLYSLSLFLPSIISGMGFTNLTAQAMSAPPYAIGKLKDEFFAIDNDTRDANLTYSMCIYNLGRYARR
jgi:hypothetical protein